MSFDNLIFTLDDVRQVRKAVSINTEDFDQYAQEVQRNYLEKILGVELYTALQNDLVDGVPQTQRFIDLVDGTQYTYGRPINYRGVKMYCCYLWLYVKGIGGDMKQTPVGAVIFKDENAQHAEGRQAEREIINHHHKTAQYMESGIIAFLENNISSYPEFSSSLETKQATEENIDFKIVGGAYYPPNNFIE